MNEYRWRDLSVGLRQSFAVRVTTEEMNLFRRLSGDGNPLHGDPGFARSMGFRDVVVFGMLTSAYYSSLIGVHLPGKYCLLHEINIQFVKPVYVGDDLKVSGTVTYLNDAYRQVWIQAEIRDGHGESVSRAKIKVGVHE